jgi:hypothetical protein
MDAYAAHRLSSTFASTVEECDSPPGLARAGPALQQCHSLLKGGRQQSESQRVVTGRNCLLKRERPAKIKYGSGQ